MSKPFLALICLPLLMGGACEKKPKQSGDTGAINALDRANSGPVDETPLPDIDVSKLSADRQKLFYKLLGSLSSPCGKPHNLRTSFSSDTACKRAPFAVRYVLAMVEDEGSESDIREAYTSKYKADKAVTLDVSKAPRFGNDDAPIRIVEFYDYACPACKAAKPVIEKVAQDNAGKVVVYYLMYPLPSHEHSRSAAQAALAAQQLGKFKEMHEALFARAPAHQHDAVVGYAKQIGLDAAQFEAAYTAAAGQVASDMEQGSKAGVEGTPTVYVNDRKFEGPLNHPKYLQMWIDEELAVNR